MTKRFSDDDSAVTASDRVDGDSAVTGDSDLDDDSAVTATTLG